MDDDVRRGGLRLVHNRCSTRGSIGRSDRRRGTGADAHAGDRTVGTSVVSIARWKPNPNELRK